jgi:hypothetical protein
MYEILKPQNTVALVGIKAVVFCGFNVVMQLKILP